MNLSARARPWRSHPQARAHHRRPGGQRSHPDGAHRGGDPPAVGRGDKNRGGSIAAPRQLSLRCGYRQGHGGMAHVTRGAAWYSTRPALVLAYPRQDLIRVWPLSSVFKARPVWCAKPLSMRPAASRRAFRSGAQLEPRRPQRSLCTGAGRGTVRYDNPLDAHVGWLGLGLLRGRHQRPGRKDDFPRYLIDTGRSSAHDHEASEVLRQQIWRLGRELKLTSGRNDL